MALYIGRMAMAVWPKTAKDFKVFDINAEFLNKKIYNFNKSITRSVHELFHNQTFYFTSLLSKS